MKNFHRQKNRGFPGSETLRRSDSSRSKFHTSQSSTAGFTLVETLVAISIFTMSILSVMAVLSSGISNTTYAKQKMTAEYLAQEGIECVRNTRDNYVLYPDSTHDWSKFVALDVNNITCPGVDSNFTRIISKGTVNTNTNNDEVKITSDVSWKQSSGTYHAIFSENLFNWIQ